MARPAFSAQQVEETRQQLCRVALGLYRKQGYEAVTLREVGILAGISHTALYRYFDSKDNLFEHVRAEVFNQLGAHLLARDLSGADPLSRLRTTAVSFAEFGRQAPEDYRLVFSMRQAPADPESALAKARKKTQLFVTSVCQQAIDAGQLSGDADTQAHLIWASVHGVISLYVSNLLVHERNVDELIVAMIDQLFSPAKKTAASLKLGRSSPAKAKGKKQAPVALTKTRPAKAGVPANTEEIHDGRQRSKRVRLPQRLGDRA